MQVIFHIYYLLILIYLIYPLFENNNLKFSLSFLLLMDLDVVKQEQVMKILHDIYDFSDGDEDIYQLMGSLNIQEKFKRGGKKLKEFFRWLHGYATTFYNNQLKELTEKKKIEEAHQHLEEIKNLLSSFAL